MRFPQTLISRYMWMCPRGSCGISIQKRTHSLFPGSSKTAAFQSFRVRIFKIFMSYDFTVSGWWWKCRYLKMRTSLPCEFFFRISHNNNSWLVNPLPVVRCRIPRLSLNWKKQQQSKAKPQQLLSLCYWIRNLSEIFFGPENGNATGIFAAPCLPKLRTQRVRSNQGSPSARVDQVHCIIFAFVSPCTHHLWEYLSFFGGGILVQTAQNGSCLAWEVLGANRAAEGVAYPI